MRDSSTMFEEFWWIEGRVRYTRFIGVSRIEDVMSIDERLVDFLDASSHPIHFVVDVRDMTQPPPLTQSLKIGHMRHANTGWVIMVGSQQNAVLRFMASIAFKVFGTKYKECSTLEEAVEFLKQADPDLSEMSVVGL